MNSPLHVLFPLLLFHSDLLAAVILFEELLVLLELRFLDLDGLDARTLERVLNPGLSQFLGLIDL